MDKEIKKELNAIKSQEKKTDLRKLSFITEITSGLGDEIKEGVVKMKENVPEKENKITKYFKKLFKTF